MILKGYLVNTKSYKETNLVDHRYIHAFNKNKNNASGSKNP